MVRIWYENLGLGAAASQQKELERMKQLNSQRGGGLAKIKEETAVSSL